MPPAHADRPLASGGSDPRPPSGGLARRALRGTAWTGASQLTGKLLFFLSTLLLARLLARDDFGVAAYAVTVITLFSAVPALGLGPALIHHDDTEAVLSTGFWLGLVSGCACFLLVWVLAPFSELLFDDPRAVDVTRALALVFPIEALRNVHATLLRKRLAFRRRFLPELLQSLTKGGVAIGLALAGLGYWSLIWGTVSAAAVSVPAYWLAARWRPRLSFDGAVARTLLPFGGHVVAVNLLGAVVRNLDYVLVGRFLGAATLGVYVLAFRIPDLLIRNLSTVFGQVLLPLYARVKSDPAAVREAFLATTSYVFALTAPVALGLSLVAEPLVVTAFGPKWIDVAPVVPPICLYALCTSVSFNMGDLYKALGRPDVLMRLSLVRAVVVVPALFYAVAGVGTATAVAWAQAGVALLATAANFVVAGALFDMPVRQALGRLVPVAGASAVLAVVTWATGVWTGAFAAGWTGAWEGAVSAGTGGDGAATLGRLLACAVAGATAYVVALRLVARDFFDTGLFTVRDALARRRPAPEPAR